MRARTRLSSIPLIALAVSAAPLVAQVALHPETIEPAAWERFALRVVGAPEAPVVRVELDLPDALTVLGTDAPPGWRFAFTPATDSTPQRIAWAGDTLTAGQFVEFAFLARLRGDVRNRQLVFPVTVERADGTRRRWGGGAGAPGPLIVRIRGSTFITSWGAAALAGAALGLSALTLALVAFRLRASGGGTGPGV